MIRVVSNAEMQELDSYTIDDLKIPGLILMENAGLKTAVFIEEYYTKNKLKGFIHVYCGKGNNGGDGYVIARHLEQDGFAVKVFATGDPKKLKGDALTNYNCCNNLKISINIIESLNNIAEHEKPALIVDALLGTGIKGPVSGFFKEIIEYINKQNLPVIAVDIPSGLNGDIATPPGAVIKARATVTMALPKRAHIFEPARSYAGELKVVKIGIPDFAVNKEYLKLNLVEKNDIKIPEMESDIHKYSAGTLFILAGSPGMTGAAYLSAISALRIGVGLVNIGLPKSLNPIMESKITEALTVPLTETAEGSLSKNALDNIKERIDWASAVLIGPGIGRVKETLSVVLDTIQYCQSNNKPTLIDADALFALSTQPEFTDKLGGHVILTPHYGEFLRLFPQNKQEFKSKPWRYLQQYLSDKQFCINLKGAPSMVASADGTVFINSTGNQGLAKGGSGDVLSGIIAGLMARGVGLPDAGYYGNYILGRAADMLAECKGYCSMLPGEVSEQIADVVKELMN